VRTTGDVGGPLAGLRVVELASEWAAYAGKLLSDLGAEVVLVEPRAGHHTRGYAPFVDDVPGPERSLWWWHYHTSKLGVALDLGRDDDLDLFRCLVGTADIVLEGEPPGTLAEWRIDHEDLVHLRPGLIMTSVTPFGRRGPRAREQATDLTLLAAGGPVWSCGYDDHALPPIRGGGNQSLHIGGAHAVMATLVAVLHRGAAGVGQHIDVSLYAAANVTTEAATYEWLVARQTVARQTCRHASPYPTPSSIAPDVEGTPVHTGVPPRNAKEFVTLLTWLHDLGAYEAFPEAVFLEMGRDRGGIRLADIATDVETQEIFRAGRDALVFIASQMRAADFFVEGQRRGLAVGVLNAPEDIMEDPHFIARGFPTRVHHDDLERDVLYPGAPFLSDASPWRVRSRAPHLGEHDGEVLGPLRAGRDE
jgi:crotonobetainyl-CoA:carnitine CoA-transferase CaiB-like acyl-CoA transferase